MTRTVVDVAIDPRASAIDRLLSYVCPFEVQEGAVVAVPLASKFVLGIVVSVRQDEANTSLKSVLARVPGLDLPGPLLELGRFMATEYLCSLGGALASALPPGARDRLVDSYRLPEWIDEGGQRRKKKPEFRLEAEDDSGLTPYQREIMRAVRDAGGMLPLSKTAANDVKLKKGLSALVEKGLLVHELRLSNPQEKARQERLYRLCADPARIEEFLHKEARRKPAQALVLIELQAAERPSGLTLGEIKALAGVTETTVKAVIESGLVEPVAEDSLTLQPPMHPTPSQKLAVDSLCEAVENRSTERFLLFGITGSGKTEVYMQAISAALKLGRQGLVLIPEIALAGQMFGRLRERFGRSAAVLHSELSQGERLNTLRRIQTGEVNVVLGARSALFAPLDRLGLIVMDEEHESAYKQDSTPRYHAKRVAQKLGELHSCPVVYGSATPSLESFMEAEHGILNLLSLPSRAANAVLPEVFIHDLTGDYRNGAPSILGDPLIEGLERTITEGHQAILFLNRRAYAPFLLCRECGFRAMCPRCSVTLSFHKSDTLLLCHHCGYRAKPPEACPDCGGTRLAPLGVGVEKVEEAVLQHFPTARVGRLDRDMSKKKGAVEETLARFRGGDIDVLVGTQMVAKGFDFPNVTLVGVIAADVSLNLPDFRASERAFQLLSQVAGRAGRGKFAGEVIVQTFNPDHPAILCAADHDTVGFLEALREERVLAHYPPAARLVNILLTSEARGAVIEAAEEVARRLKLVPGVDVLGPVDCVLSRLQDRWRRHVLVKLPPYEPPCAIGEALAGFEPRGVTVMVDVDPYSLM